MRAKPAINLLSDGSTTNANGNYSAAAKDFYWGPTSAEDFLLHCLDVIIIDSAIHAEGYGAAAAALVNGISFIWKLDGTELAAGAGSVTRNRSWIAVADDVQLVDFSVPTQSMLRCRVEIGKFYKDPAVPRAFDGIGGVLLQGHRGDRVIVRFNDDLTGLVVHTFAVRGGRYLDWISKKNQEI
jgi:hypothetical protein